MPKPVCVPCRRFFRIKRSGRAFIEGMPAPGETRPPPGPGRPGLWQPYKVWAADLWECPACGTQILCGFGMAPIAERHHEDFERTIDTLQAHELIRRRGDRR